ncbi:hypothetical protein EHQ46_02830 [Leptospira yanagawae]|uniref:Uncharacterized protein n=1 Tax=Leptospira yanagawae TaxID=293069 RepID=A0ABY2M831_9LEPT|nr:hypothetical protein [Leptospira yanagawae]TGL24077.1 hypothetical protein EHQ46_02830 [Leptospira yanagawae]
MLEAFLPSPKERVSLWFFASGWSKSKIPQFLDKVEWRPGGWLLQSKDPQKGVKKAPEQVKYPIKTNKY